MTLLTWDDLERGIADGLPYLRVGDTVVLRNAPFYVQLAQTRESLILEAVSNANLPAGRRLSDGAERRLPEFSWNPPDKARNGHENWWRETPWPITTGDGWMAALCLTRTLREAFETPSPANLTYRAFNDVTDQPPSWSVLWHLTEEAQ